MIAEISGTFELWHLFLTLTIPYYIIAVVESEAIPIKTHRKIENPSEYLTQLFPDCAITFKDGCQKIDDEAVEPYIVRDYNACGEHATAAILKYYLGDAYSFSDILDRCKIIARENGYARCKNGVWNYYIPVGKLAPFVQKCIDFYGVGKKARSSLFTWRTGKKELAAGRPIMLNIAYTIDGSYKDHTVLAYAYSSLRVGNLKSRRFFKIKDGYSKNPRFACHNAIIGCYITRVV